MTSAHDLPPELTLRSHDDGSVTVVGEAPEWTWLSRHIYGQMDRHRLSLDGRRVAVADDLVYELGEYVWDHDVFVIRRVSVPRSAD